MTETKPRVALVKRAQQFIDEHDGEVKGGFGLHLEFAGWVDSSGSYSSEELQRAVKHAKQVKERDPHEGPWTEGDEQVVFGNFLEYALRYGFELGYAFAKQDREPMKRPRSRVLRKPLVKLLKAGLYSTTGGA
jgi:hypothetical protein